MFLLFFFFPKHFCHFCLLAVLSAQSGSCCKHLPPRLQTGEVLPRWSIMSKSPLPKAFCRCHHTMSLPWLANCLASCLPRTMLPQVSGSIWVVSLGAKRHTGGWSAGEAAGAGGAVPYQMDRGSQKTMKASITKGKTQKSHIYITYKVTYKSHIK